VVGIEHAAASRRFIERQQTVDIQDLDHASFCPDQALVFKLAQYARYPLARGADLLCQGSMGRRGPYDAATALQLAIPGQAQQFSQHTSARVQSKQFKNSTSLVSGNCRHRGEARLFKRGDFPPEDSELISVHVKKTTAFVANNAHSVAEIRMQNRSKLAEAGAATEKANGNRLMRRRSDDQSIAAAPHKCDSPVKFIPDAQGVAAPQGS
jgi:hypothetical protein